jgi:hypothetical protein
MESVYIRIDADLISSLPMFFRKLRRFVGSYRVTGPLNEYWRFDILTIYFDSDKNEFKGYSPRQVSLEIKRNLRGSWYFTKILE